MSIICLNLISRAGSGLSGIKFSILILALCLIVPNFVYGRDVGTITQWLCNHIFEGNGATLVLSKNGFFGLRLNVGKKTHRDLTGLWRISNDGIELALYNNQDAEIKLTVGEIALHSILPQIGDATLIPVQKQYAPFQIIGLLQGKGQNASITDANSGKQFKVNAKNAPEGKFATAEIELGPAGAKTGKILAHSGSVPRYFHLPKSTKSSNIFLESVVNRYWLLPSMKGIQAGSLRFSAPVPDSKNKKLIKGSYEISGPGLRLDGTYILSDEKLTLQASRASIHNLILMGAESVVKAFIGDLTWQLSPAGLELQGKERLLLLAADY